MMGFALISHLSQLASGSLVTAIWQGILLVVATGLGLRLVPKTPPAVQFAIWFAVFLIVTALPLDAFWPRATGAGNHAWITVNERWCLVIAAVWAVASAVRAATLVAAGFRVRALWKRATPVELTVFANPTNGDEAVVNGAADPMATLTRRAEICVSDEVDRPTVIGFFAPKILIPAWLLEKLSPAELEQIVLHESGHLGRADDWMNLLQKIALVIFPLNPALAWVERRLCFERELAVDERVLRAFAGRAGAAKAYAACLATLAEYRLGRRAMTLALGALGRESELGRRVGRILRRGEAMRPLHAKLVLGGAMLGLVVGAAGLERCPQIVGFADGSAPTVVSDSQDQIVEHPLISKDGARPSAVGVIYKTHNSNSLQDIQHVAHATLAVAMETPSKATEPKRMTEPQDNATGPGAVHMVQTVTPMPARQQPRTVSDTEPATAQSYAVQWVTVTEWQREDGTHVVLTTTRTATVDQQEEPTSAEDGTSRNDVQHGPDVRQLAPYAAVPVRGGWLVFQL